MNGEDGNRLIEENVEDLRIAAVDKNFWVGKQVLKINDIERAHGDVIRLEEGVNRAFRQMNRRLNLNGQCVNRISNDVNTNFAVVEARITTLGERVDQIEVRLERRAENDSDPEDSANSQASDLGDYDDANNGEGNGNDRNRYDAGELDRERIVFGINTLTTTTGLEMFSEESLPAFDEWTERLKDYLLVSGRNWTEEEKVARLRLSLGGTARALFKELTDAQASTLKAALKALREKLDSPQRRELAKRTLALCKQRSEESVAQFLRRLTPLVESTNPNMDAALLKVKLCEEFIDRLKPDISFMIRLVGLTKAKDLELVRSQAEELEAMLLLEKAQVPNQLSQVINALRQTSNPTPLVEERDDDKRDRGNVGQGNPPPGFRPFNSNNWRGGQNPRRGRNERWNRNQQQRMGERTWSNRPLCHYCHKPGHLAYACRQRKDDYMNGSRGEQGWQNQNRGWQEQGSSGQRWTQGPPRNRVNVVEPASNANIPVDDLVRALVGLSMQNDQSHASERGRTAEMNLITEVRRQHKGGSPTPRSTEKVSGLPARAEKKDVVEKQEGKKSRVSNWEGRSIGPMLHLMTMMIAMIMALAIPVAIAETAAIPRHPLVCQTQREGVIWELPEFSSCSQPTLNHSKTPVSKLYDIYVSNPNEYDTDAWVCRKVRKSLRKSTSITSVPLKENLDPEMLEVSYDECKQMIEHGKCSLGVLKNEGGMWHTDRKIDETPRMWLLGSFDWKTVSSENCYLFKIKVSKRFGDSTVKTPLGSASCAFSSGKCLLEDRTMIVWNTNSTAQCEYSLVGRWSGLKLDKTWLSDEASLRLTLPNTTSKVYSCGIGLEKSIEGFAVREVSRKRTRSKRWTPESPVFESELNSKLGYLDTKMAQMLTLSFRHAFKSFCEYVEETRRWAASSLLSDPTSLARVIFHDGRLIAKRVGPTLMKVWPCIGLEADKYEFTPIGPTREGSLGCYDLIPIKFRSDSGERLAFVDPKTMIITPFARKAPCQEFRKQLIRVNGQILEVDQLTAQVSRVSANKIAGAELSALSPEFPTHTFHHLALLNITDLVSHSFMTNLVRVSEITYGIHQSDLVITETMSEEWDEVKDKLSESLFGNWLMVGRVTMAVMVTIVFVDFCIRFGLTIRDAYIGKAGPERMRMDGRLAMERRRPSPVRIDFPKVSAPISREGRLQETRVRMEEEYELPDMTRIDASKQCADFVPVRILRPTREVGEKGSKSGKSEAQQNRTGRNALVRVIRTVPGRGGHIVLLGRVKNQQVRSLLDTGAEVTVAPLAFAQRHGCVLEDTDVRLSTVIAGQPTIAVIGIAKLPVRMNGWPKVKILSFYIVDDGAIEFENYDFIFGMSSIEESFAVMVVPGAQSSNNLTVAGTAVSPATNQPSTSGESSQGSHHRVFLLIKAPGDPTSSPSPSPSPPPFPPIRFNIPPFPRINLTVNTLPSRALVDIGSDITLGSHTLCQRLLTAGTPELRLHGNVVTLILPNQRAAVAFNVGAVTLMMEGIVRIVDMHFLEEDNEVFTEFDCIIGRNVTDQIEGVIIDPRNGVFLIDHSQENSGP